MALTVILAAVVGPVSLITRGLFSFSFSKNKVIAANLAQEGIELIRLVRENNVACDSVNGPPVHHWDSDPDGGRIKELTMSVDASDFVPIRRQGGQNPCGGVTIRSPRLSISCLNPLLFETDPQNYGRYGHLSGVETIFRRCVEIAVKEEDASGCYDPDSGSGDINARDCDIPAPDQMDIISTVTWKERGIDKDLTLRERLYDWR